MLRRFLIKYVTPIVWRSSPRRLASAVRRFSDVEADSGWQALQLLHLCDDPKKRAVFFALALEESAHARMFRNAALEIDPDVERRWAAPERATLYDEKKGLAAAVADITVNEIAVYKEFGDYADCARSAPRLRAIFEKIKTDEAGHGDDADGLLADLTQDAAALRAQLRKAERRRFFRVYMSGSKVVGEHVIGLLLRATFFLFGWMPAIFGRAGAGRAVTNGARQVLRDEIRAGR